ncbi:MAG TPA: hypothetical protein P5527_02340 [Kiritimatiellia bacterium]|nr:hypothetical protein [Kiritimatiellia bacterium]
MNAKPLPSPPAENAPEPQATHADSHHKILTREKLKQEALLSALERAEQSGDYTREEMQELCRQVKERILDSGERCRLVKLSHETLTAVGAIPNGETLPTDGKGDKATPTECGRLHVKVWGKELTYPVTKNGDTEIKTFHVKGAKQWEDLRKLMEADGNFVEMGKGFIQRWNLSDAKELRKAAFEAASGRGPRGTGSYRVIK